jgi:hypothetical protein
MREAYAEAVRVAGHDACRRRTREVAHVSAARSRRRGRSVASRGNQLADRGVQARAGIAAALRPDITKEPTMFEAIDDSALSTITGGASRAKLLEQLVERIGNSDLTKKQIAKLGKKLSGFEKKAAKGVPAIAEGDFGASPSNYISITGD